MRPMGDERYIDIYLQFTIKLKAFMNGGKYTYQSHGSYRIGEQKSENKKDMFWIS